MTKMIRSLDNMMYENMLEELTLFEIRYRHPFVPHAQLPDSSSSQPRGVQNQDYSLFEKNQKGFHYGVMFPLLPSAPCGICCFSVTANYHLTVCPLPRQRNGQAVK